MSEVINSGRLPLVAMVGRPNVGKSSFFNRLTRSRKAIVDDTPGVTRDRHYGRVRWDAKEFILIDTGGLEPEESDDVIATRAAFPGESSAGIRKKITGNMRSQALTAAMDADIVLFMVDGREGLSSEDIRIYHWLRKSDKPVMVIVNKVDGPELEATLLPSFFEMGVEELWPVSSAHGYGVRSFLDQLTAGFKPAIVADDKAEDFVAADPEEEPDAGEGVPLPAAIRTAVIGRPNVGKSSLVNRLVGEERMVVSEMPGTTRDSIDTVLRRGNKEYRIIDTAGIRRKGKVRQKIEKFSVIRALKAIEESDVAMVLIDADEGITEQDAKIIGYALERGRGCLVIINKWDLLAGKRKRMVQVMEEIERQVRFVGYAPLLKVSALTGSGCKRILPMVDRMVNQAGRKFGTGVLNRVLTRAVEGHSPPLYRGRRLKFFYATQVGVRPPSFLLFVNYPDAVHFSYYRYLINCFREGLGLDLIPFNIKIRERNREQRGGKKRKKRP